MVVAGVAGLPDAPVDHPQRRREPVEDRLDLLGGAPSSSHGNSCAAPRMPFLRRWSLAEPLPLGLGERALHQRQRIALLVGQVTVQLEHLDAERQANDADTWWARRGRAWLAITIIAGGTALACSWDRVAEHPVSVALVCLERGDVGGVLRAAQLVVHHGAAGHRPVRARRRHLLGHLQVRLELRVRVAGWGPRGRRPVRAAARNTATVTTAIKIHSDHASLPAVHMTVTSSSLSLSHGITARFGPIPLVYLAERGRESPSAPGEGER
jgi:hypothetical protein